MKARLHKNLLVGLHAGRCVRGANRCRQGPGQRDGADEACLHPGAGWEQRISSRWESFRGGPGGGGTVFPSHYLGHELGGPGSAGGVSVAYPFAAANGGGGLDWADAAVGAGFMAGIALLVAAGLLAMRRRRALAHA